MIAYATRRVLSALPIVFIALTVCFIILRLAPGGPFDGERALPPAVLKNLEAYYNLDKPLWEQYFIYVGGVLRGDFGPSMVNGMVTAVYQNRWPDYLLVFLVMIGLVVPNFLMANIVQLVFGVHLRWLPVGGYTPGSFIHLVLPVIILSLPQAARISRLMRGSMIEVLGTNFVRTARSKGLGTRLVLARHAIKPAMMPVVSYLGPGLSYLLTGSLVVEQIFALPGIGKYFITAALSRDYGLVLGTTILYMVIILVLNLVVDVIYAWLDPKVRYR